MILARFHLARMAAAGRFSVPGFSRMHMSPGNTETRPSMAAAPADR